MDTLRRGPLGSRGYGSLEFPHFQRVLWYTELKQGQESRCFTLRSCDYSMYPTVVFTDQTMDQLHQVSNNEIQLT